MKRTSVLRRLALVLVLAMGSGRLRAEEPPAPPDYKVVYWFDWSDPIPTFRHHAYDVRKGEYPAKAVEAWKAELRQSHPDYAVLIRDVRLADLPGETDAEKLKEVIQRQFSEVVLIASVPGPTPSLGPPVAGVGEVHRQSLRPEWSVWSGTGLRPIREVNPLGRRPLGAAEFRTGPGMAPMPFPMPYPRPHP